jgi:hypothetical protein
MGLEMEGAMQQAAQPGRQSMGVAIDFVAVCARGMGRGRGFNTLIVAQIGAGG